MSSLFFLLFSHACFCMQLEQPSTLYIIDDIVENIAVSTGDLETTVSILSTCKKYFDIDSFLLKNKDYCHQLASHDYTKVLIHYAQVHNEKMFTHIMENESDNNKRIRECVLRTFQRASGIDGLDVNSVPNLMTVYMWNYKEPKSVVEHTRDAYAVRVLLYNKQYEISSQNYHIIPYKLQNDASFLQSAVDAGDVVIMEISPGSCMCAVMQGHVMKIVTLLLQNGALLSVPCKTMLSALVSAICSAKEDVVRSLLSLGLDCNMQDSGGRTALMCAAHHGQENIINMLIEAGVDVNIQDHEGLTALMWAVSCCRENIVNSLIQAGADVDMKDNMGDTALVLAKYYQLQGMVKILRQNNNAKDKKRNCIMQ